MKLTTHFNLDEFTSKDGTPFPEDLIKNGIELCENLEILRAVLNKPIIPTHNGGYRSKNQNKKIGGKPKSQHMNFKAIDMTVDGYQPREIKIIIEKLIKEKKMKQGGIGLYVLFLHYDIRGTKARW